MQASLDSAWVRVTAGQGQAQAAQDAFPASARLEASQTHASCTDLYVEGRSSLSFLG